MSEIKSGDVVVLKSDQTQNKMTVGQIKGDETECVWFDHNKVLHRASISVDALKVSENDGGKVEIG